MRPHLTLLVAAARRTYGSALVSLAVFGSVGRGTARTVGGLVLQFTDRLPEAIRPDLERLAAISKWLRKEREFAFYGDEDFVPTEEYGSEDARRAMADAAFAVDRATAAIPLDGR